MAIGYQKPGASVAGVGAKAGRERHLLSAALAAGWAVAAVGAVVLVWHSQVDGRSALVWDEAARVDAGAALVYALKSGDLPAVWTWLNTQVFYPFVVPGLNGLFLLATSDPVEAAWLPSLLAYGAAGLFAGRLANILGAGQIGAAFAAIMTWSTPLFARVGAGGFTEPIGACVLLCLLVALVSEVKHPTVRSSIACGAIAALAWFVKYDYGILAVGTLTATLAATAVAERNHPTVKVKHVAAAFVSVLVPTGIWFAFNTSAKLHGAFAFVGQATPGAAGHPDFGFYPAALFQNGEVGLGIITAIVFCLGVVIVMIDIRRGLVFIPLVCLALWYLMYSTATIRYARYLAVAIPLLAALAGIAASRTIARTRPWPTEMRRLGVSVAAVVIVAQLVLQTTASDTGLAVRFWFLQPDPSTNAALRFAVSHLKAEDGPALMLGQTNEFSPAALHVEWDADLGRPAPTVNSLGESGAVPTRDSLEQAITAFGVRQIVGVFVGPGSSLDTTDYRTTFPSQPTYLQLADSLASSGYLAPIDSLKLEDGKLRIVIWVKP
jgi:hypothetical protein